MRNPMTACAALLLTATLSACTGTDTPATQPPVKEIFPGFLEGYIPRSEALASVEFLPHAPAPDSPRQALDDRVFQQMQTLRGSERWDLAIADAQLRFPDAALAFSCTLGIGITEQDTPDLYMLLRRTLPVLGMTTASAKDAYQRPRPFMVNDVEVCTPERADSLRKDGSYPSGHTAIGWGWALILAELDPQRAEAILARGRAFGESRNVCNAHWRSDVISGRMAGAAAVVQLRGNGEFRAAMLAARRDIERARSAGVRPTRDCEWEARALATMPE